MSRGGGVSDSGGDGTSGRGGTSGLPLEPVSPTGTDTTATQAGRGGTLYEDIVSNVIASPEILATLGLGLHTGRGGGTGDSGGEGTPNRGGAIPDSEGTVNRDGAVADSFGSTPMFRGYEFQFGLDNLRTGVTQHTVDAVYVSSPMSIDGVKQLGLKVVENRPYTSLADGVIRHTTQTYDNNIDNADRLFLGSIEYWVIYRHLVLSNGRGRNRTISHSHVFPILPIGVERVHHERLLLTERSNPLSLIDVGTTIFFTNAVDGNIQAFRNGFPIDQDVEWSDITTTDDITPNSGVRMKMRIKVSSPLPGDVFTISYDPLISSTRALPETLSAFDVVGGTKIVDLTGDLVARVVAGQVVAMNHVEQEGDSALVYLMIILRRNTANTSITPAVEEYTLVAGKEDPAKFESL